MPIRSYRDLEVWQRAMDLVCGCYSLCDGLPDSERFNLIDQIRRSATSIPSNIAEGHARHSTRDYIKHLSYAEGSLAELGTQVEIASRIGLLTKIQAVETLSEIEGLGRQLSALVRALKNKLHT